MDLPKAGSYIQFWLSFFSSVLVHLVQIRKYFIIVDTDNVVSYGLCAVDVELNSVVSMVGTLFGFLEFTAQSFRANVVAYYGLGIRVAKAKGTNVIKGCY